MVRRILPSLTTVTPGGVWRKKVKEIDELGVKELSLFLTGIEIGERKELYDLLEKTGLENVPHVHLRNDMEVPELDYLTARFKAEVFNIHPENSLYPFLFDYGKYAKNVYVENNSESVPSKNDLKKYGGLCLDLSHWESCRREKGEADEKNKRLKEMAGRKKIGVNHISAIKPEIVSTHDANTGQYFYGYDFHWLDNLSEVDYVKKYKDYLADIISIELENPLKRQLEVKKYLEKILDL